MALKDIPNMSNLEPFFLVGAVRSGTTLLRLLLGHHPEICRCEEMEFVATPLELYRGPPKIADYHHYLDLDRNFRLSGYSYDSGLDFQAQSRDFLRQRKQMDRRPIVGATVHNHFNRLLEVWPEAKYIFLVRDPRDVARSCVQMGWTGTAWGGARFWIDAQRQWKSVLSVVPPERRREIRFEDLICNSTDVLEELCRFLGTAYDSAMLEIERDTTYRRPDPNESRSWRDSASEMEVREVETRIGTDALASAGYLPSGYAPLTMTGAVRMAITLKDLFVRVRFRIRRYGLGLWLAGVVSRRLPSTSWRENVQFRIDEVNNSHLK